MKFFWWKSPSLTFPDPGDLKLKVVLFIGNDSIYKYS